MRYYPQPFGISAATWNFDGSQYTWEGECNPDNDNYVFLSGRTVVTPYPQHVLQDKLGKYLAAYSGSDSDQYEQLLQAIAGWDILVQSLGGFTNQLLTRLPHEGFAPPAGDLAAYSLLTPPAAIPIGSLVQHQYHSVPQTQGIGSADTFFQPVRAGLVTIPPGCLRLVDTFGQTFDLTQPNTSPSTSGQAAASFQLVANSAVQGSGQSAAFVLAPRLAQGARLDFTLQANDGSGDARTSPSSSNSVCGWLLPNYLDKSLLVYDEAGVPLGELLDLPDAGPGPAAWRPRPGPAGAVPPPRHPSQISNHALRSVDEALAQSASRVHDFLYVVDEALWTVLPAPGSSDAFLSALVGRPLAVVQVGVALTLSGPPAVSQLWDAMLTPGSTLEQYATAWEDGKITDPSTFQFPVRLGSADLRNDGLLGYFMASDYSQFYAAGMPTATTTEPTPSFIQPIVSLTDSNSDFTGEIFLTPDNPGELLTLVLDPRGAVHATTGILPVQSIRLPDAAIAQFLRSLLITFQTGPLLADPGQLRTLRPAGKHGTWHWLQLLDHETDEKWEHSGILGASGTARLPTLPPTLRECWPQLSDLPADF